MDRNCQICFLAAAIGRNVYTLIFEERPRLKTSTSAPFTQLLFSQGLLNTERRLTVKKLPKLRDFFVCCFPRSRTQSSRPMGQIAYSEGIKR